MIEGIKGKGPNGEPVPSHIADGVLLKECWLALVLGSLGHILERLDDGGGLATDEHQEEIWWPIKN